MRRACQGLQPVPGGDSHRISKEELEKEINANRDTEFVILTDVFGGSVCNALMTLTGL